MRLFTFALAATTFCAATPVPNASFSDIAAREGPIPQYCQATVEIAAKESKRARDWVETNVCKKGHKVSYDMVKDHVDQVVKRYLDYVWPRVSPPFDIKKEVVPLYYEIKRDCIEIPKRGVLNYPDLCHIDDYRLWSMSRCVEAKVVPRYAVRTTQLIKWIKQNCAKGAPLIKQLLVLTRGKLPCTFFLLLSLGQAVYMETLWLY